MGNSCIRRPSFFLFPRLLWGTIAIAAGLFLMGFNTGYLPIEYKPIIFSFPFLLVVIGLLRILCRRHMFPSFVMVGIGLYFLAPKLGILHPNYSHWITPILLVLVGFVILFHQHNHAHKMHRFWKENEPNFPESHTPTTNGLIRENRVFSGSRRKIRGEDFRGGEINCVFGGCELDLSEATLPEGTNRLDINCVFGGVTLLVPDSWNVQLQVNSVFGDFQDRRRVSLDRRDPNRVLQITGSCVFGGGEVKYAIV